MTVYSTHHSASMLRFHSISEHQPTTSIRRQIVEAKIQREMRQQLTKKERKKKEKPFGYFSPRFSLSWRSTNEWRSLVCLELKSDPEMCGGSSDGIQGKAGGEVAIAVLGGELNSAR